MILTNLQKKWDSTRLLYKSVLWNEAKYPDSRAFGKRVPNQLNADGHLKMGNFHFLTFESNIVTRTTLTGFVRGFLFLLLAGGLALSASAKVTITPKVDNNTLRVGEQTRLSITVTAEGEEIQGNLATPSIDGLSFVNAGVPRTIQSTSFINGRMQIMAQYVFAFDVFGLKEGKFNVTGFTIQTSGGVVEAPAFAVTVFPAGQPVPTRSPSLSGPQNTNQYNIYMLSDSSKPEVYVGEELLITYDGVYHMNWKNWFDSVKSENRDYAVFNEERGALKNFLAEPVNLKFKGNSQPVRMTGSNDLYYQQPLIRYILFALTPGEYTLNPLTVDFMIPVRDRRTLGFNMEAVNVRPDPIKVKVKPLPEEGKPDIFEGAVGTFTLKAEADPLELKEGETVTLKVILEGIGNIKNAPKPKLPDLSKFDQFDPTQKENISTDENGMRGQIEFSYILIPHDVNSNQIGSVRYAFFDPAQKKYAVQETQPIQLTILPSTGGNRTGPNTPFNRRLITRVGDDFRFIVTAPTALATIALPIHHSIQFWFFFFLPLILVLLAWLWKRRQEFLAARPSVAKSIRAPRLARKLLANARQAMTGSDPQAVYILLGKAVTDFISNRWNLACAGMTSLELRETLNKRGVGTDLIQSVIQILEDFDGIRFSGTVQSATQIEQDFARTEELLGNLMKTKISE